MKSTRVIVNRRRTSGRGSNPWVIGNDRVVAYVQTAQSCAVAGLAAYQ